MDHGDFDQLPSLHCTITTLKMRRFSDRLTSSSSHPSEQGKGLCTSVNGSSDESLQFVTGEATGPSDCDRVYATLVEMLGLHQTVKALEAEYSAITGGDNKGFENHNSKTG